VRVADASWQRPEGPGSHVLDRPGHPVVHVSWRDATSYCAWSATRLPSEAEWERAARGGLEGKRFAWGDELNDAAGVPRCNVFRGEFPGAPTSGWMPAAIDASAGAANGFGLFNVCGNVWEWCDDRWPDDRRAPARRLVSLPRLVLQPIPRRGAPCQHGRHVDEPHRLSCRAVGLARPARASKVDELPGAAGAGADRRRIHRRAPAATLVLNSLFASGSDAN
jgi:hypothetical protein